MHDIILSTKSLTKDFYGVTVLNNINVEFNKGEVHAILGENGAGKSTLIKLLNGVYQPSSGHFTFKGHKISNTVPRAMMNLGMATIYQELSLISELSIAENIFLGRELIHARLKLNNKKMIDMAGDILRKYKIMLDPRAKIRDISIANTQLIEIIRAISINNSDLVIMDEPTDVLTDKETKILFGIINSIREQNKTIIYITHRLEEVKVICDRFSVLRDGNHIISAEVAGHEKKDFISHMVGRSVSDLYPFRACPVGENVLRVKDFCKTGITPNISFDIRRGEILGVYGLIGSGRTEIMECLQGISPYQSADIQYLGKRYSPNNPQKAIRDGIIYITEDRKSKGLWLNLPVQTNMTVLVIYQFISKVIQKIYRKRETELATQTAKEYQLKYHSLNQKIGNLSGGNQQKILLARALLAKPRLLIIDEPTRGIDVGAKVSIYNILNELKSQGIAIMMISSELPEVMGISDRIMVLCKGLKTGVIHRQEFDEKVITQLAFG